MNADYKNWMPDWLVAGSATCAAFLTGLSIGLYRAGKENEDVLLKTAALGSAAGAAAAGTVAAWTIVSKSMYSYRGKRKLSKQIIEGTASYVHLPENGTGLDIGCGSGALTIACAKNNPQGKMIGIDRWGADYSSFSQKLCERNARAEGITNVEFRKGNAIHLDFPDETFDVITSNYVYHDLPAKNPKERQRLLLDAMRVLKKGGTFVIHDLFQKRKYGDMDEFLQTLKDAGIAEVCFIPTDNGMFMTKQEAALLWCTGAGLLIGKK